MATGGDKVPPLELIGEGDVKPKRKVRLVSDEEEKVLEVCSGLGVENANELMELLKRAKRSDRTSSSGEVFTSSDPDLATAGRLPSYHFPKLSTFYGEPGKGDVSWVTLKFEIESLRKDKLFAEEQILLGIRRALKGNASDKIRRLGTGATLDDVIRKLESEYGNIETKESILRKFYSCEQNMGETISVYTSRLEEIFEQAVMLGALHRTDDESQLKRVVYEGLLPDIKRQACYKHDTIPEYDNFKRELRKIEAENKRTRSDAKPCKAATEKKDDMQEIKEMLQKMNARMDQLERDKHKESQVGSNSSAGQHFYPRGAFIPRFQRGTYRGGYRGTSHGRGNYRPERPLAATTFQGACFRCGERGHIARECKKNLGNQQTSQKDLNK